MLIGRVWEDQKDVLHLTHMAARGGFRADVEEALEPLRSVLIEALRRGVTADVMRTDVPEAALAWYVEQAAWDTLVLASRRPHLSSDWRRLAMTHALCASGLGWREAVTVAHSAGARLDAEHGTTTSHSSHPSGA